MVPNIQDEFVKQLTPIEAAMQFGTSVELLDYFRVKCPKKGQNRVLKANISDGLTWYDEAELLSYQKYLNEPWPHAKGKRPTIPEAIKKDVREEAHLCCAICGDANNGEVAHIIAVAESLNNSPDNLIYLCPNHHTQYDLGFKPSNNLTLETVQAAKLLKRESRVRIQRYEANTTKLLHHVGATLKELLRKMSSGQSADILTVYDTEMRQLVQSVPELLHTSEELARRDRDVSSVDEIVRRYAPNIAKATLGIGTSSRSSQVRTAATGVVDSIEQALIEIDEVDCPHCNGRGLIGLVGDFCQFCHGDMVVSKEQAATYDRDALDEVPCPRCGGRGFTGLNGDHCAYCKGSCVMSSEEAQAYNEEEIDEVDCPRCGGTGMTGLVGDRCAYCEGSCYVSRYQFDDYDPQEIDEVDCPRCGGTGMTGLAGDACAFCKGSCYISKDRAGSYKEEDIDEVDCPHCAGRGMTGLNSTQCVYCKGSCFVSREDADAYDRSEIDETDCPRCGGSGMTGLNNRQCALCKGDCTVTREEARFYMPNMETNDDSERDLANGLLMPVRRSNPV
jgi:oligoribonuclease (3'-5' exoribonuclease)